MNISDVYREAFSTHRHYDNLSQAPSGHGLRRRPCLSQTLGFQGHLHSSGWIRVSKSAAHRLDRLRVFRCQWRIGPCRQGGLNEKLLKNPPDGEEEAGRLEKALV